MFEKLKNKLIYYWKKLGHPFFSVLGVVAIGVGGAYVSNYNCSAAWQHVNSVSTFIAFCLTNSYLWISFGAFIYLSSEYIRYEKTDHINGENNSLKDQINSAKDDLLKEQEKVAEFNKFVNSNQENIQFLNNQIYDLQNKIAISWLKQAFKQHEINSTERASIYFELNKEFSLLARYSPNPELNEIHRQKFPLNQGVISHAWRHGFCIESECPSFEDNSEAYHQYMHEKYDFSLTELQIFKMKSCCYVAVAICNVDDHIGVVVFESTDKVKLNLEKLVELRDYCKSYEGHLAAFIQESKALEVAKRMGSVRTKDNADTDILSALSEAGGEQ